MNNFKKSKIGDKVICVNPNHFSELNRNSIYTIKRKTRALKKNLIEVLEIPLVLFDEEFFIEKD